MEKKNMWKRLLSVTLSVCMIVGLITVSEPNKVVAADESTLIENLMENGSFALKLFCMDPSTNLKEAMAKGKSSILFSATLLPIQYYKKLLGGDTEDYEMYAKSVFNPNQKALFI